MNLQQYQLKVRYEPGKYNPADYISRHPIPMSDSDDGTERYVSYITENAVPKAMSLSEVIHTTNEDRVLQCVISCIRSGQWHITSQGVSRSEISKYEIIREHLTVYDSAEGSVILHGHKLVIPAVLQECVINLAHENRDTTVRESVIPTVRQDG
jgi:hypothetical protein